MLDSVSYELILNIGESGLAHLPSFCSVVVTVRKSVLFNPVIVINESRESADGIFFVAC